MAERNNNGLLSQGKGLDPFRSQAKKAYERGGLLGFLGEGAEGVYELGRGAATIFGNQVRRALYGDEAVERVVPSAENSALAQAILDFSAERQGRPSTLARRDVPPPPGFVPTGGPAVQSSPVEQRIAIEDAERAELTRRGQVVTPPSAIDMTGGMTGAEAYRRGAAQDRAMDAEAFRDEQARLVQAEALKQKMNQANATGTPSVMPYIAAGTDQGQNARERSFLERMSQSGLLSTLQGMARAERQYGVGPLAAFSESALDVQAARGAAEQKQREMELELAKEQLKAGDGGDAIRKMLVKGETQKLLSTAANTFKMINASEEIRKLLGQEGASGLANSAKTWATQFGNIFGLNLEATSRQTVEKLSATIKQQMAGSRIFGRDLSATDYKTLAEVLIDPTVVTSDKAIRDQYKRLINNLEQTHAQSVKSLNILIGRDTTRQLLKQSEVTGDLFKNYNQGK